MADPVTREQLDALRRRWSLVGPMGEPRSDEDYTDAGCRILARAAFADVPVLIAEVERLSARLAAVEALCERWEADEREHLAQFGQHHPASLTCLADQLRAALRGESKP